MPTPEVHHGYQDFHGTWKPRCGSTEQPLVIRAEKTPAGVTCSKCREIYFVEQCPGWLENQKRTLSELLKYVKTTGSTLDDQTIKTLQETRRFLDQVVVEAISNHFTEVKGDDEKLEAVLARFGFTVATWEQYVNDVEE